ncbi:PTS IIA-like nitrogen regulatory protein PtsN [Psychromonas sp. psych-6C06]|uniref:PTS sugar transporter subunit IIA n=1 Tax=Psychromonas sp. psych-6C06 TaxID=2058089 RepID=UPI000C338189|nr:PTS sugar transporter subunit IIA [Psychromonas sp. psych-6C06]PKF60458.1 PTS IIA-like nitrogen regulatory protein PtsN [Psychromonas sp. psych-6C06]
MKISDLLDKDSVFSQTSCSSKKCALEKISIIAAEKLDIDSQQLFNSLIAREKIGSTGVGLGIAIPHVKIDSSYPATAIFMQCHSGIDYDSYDGNKVDILFAIFVPEDKCQEYLQALSEISQKLLDKPYLRQLRSAQTNEQLYNLLQIE